VQDATRYCGRDLLLPHTEQLFGHLGHHETDEPQTHGYWGRADDTLEQLQPDDFVDERGATAGGEEHRAQRGQAWCR
jgi:hypothetical protein